VGDDQYVGDSFPVEMLAIAQAGSVDLSEAEAVGTFEALLGGVNLEVGSSYPLTAYLEDTEDHASDSRSTCQLPSSRGRGAVALSPVPFSTQDTSSSIVSCSELVWVSRVGDVRTSP